MNSLIKVLSTEIDALARRVVKFIRHGPRDTRTSLQVAPYGIDSHPIQNMVAVYSKTGTNGKDIVIGYINKNALAELGEMRIFSTDSAGMVKTYVHLKNDGVMLLGGEEDFAVRYSKLEKAFNDLKSDLNAHIQKYNTHTHTGVSSGGATSGTVTPGQTATQSSADITPAKIERIKTP